MEESEGQQEELFSMDDIKLEVMRARGAGGQVGSIFLISIRLNIIFSACE